MQNISKKLVLEALANVLDPDLHKDLVTLNMIEDLTIDGEIVNFSIVLTTPACPLKDKIKNEAYNAVANIRGVGEVNITMKARVKEDKKLIDHNIKNVIAVGSGKGGVGKSTMAVNLAVHLAQTGSKVGLLDADIYGPNIPMMMGVTQLPPIPKDSKIQPAVAYGVKIMSIGFLVQSGQPLIWRGPMLHSAIKQFLTDVDWGELDYLIVDLPPGTGDVQLSLVQTIPTTGGIIVTTPQMVSFDDAYRAVSMFTKLDIPVLGIVENMSYLRLENGTTMNLFGEGGGLKLATVAGVKFLGAIPIDPNIRLGGDEGKPIVTFANVGEVSEKIKEISNSIAQEVSILTHGNQVQG